MLDLSKLKAFTDDILKCIKIMISLFDRVGNTLFSKASFLGSLKGIVWQRVKRKKVLALKLTPVKKKKEV